MWCYIEEQYFAICDGRYGRPNSYSCSPVLPGIRHYKHHAAEALIVCLQNMFAAVPERCDIEYEAVRNTHGATQVVLL